MHVTRNVSGLSCESTRELEYINFQVEKMTVTFWRGKVRNIFQYCFVDQFQ